MGKTRKIYNHRYENDDYEERNKNNYSESRFDKRFWNALRTKNIDTLIEIEELDYNDD